MLRIRIFFALACVLAAADVAAQDLDLDGVADYRDRCLAVSNPNQLDPDLDGFGNRCDGDFDQDGDTDADDQAFFFTSCTGFSFPPVCDLSEDGLLNAADAATFAALLGQPPGPSGFGCAGSAPCPSGVPAVPALGAGATGGALAWLALAVVARRFSSRRAAARPRPPAR